MADLHVGIMSGTSLDGADAVLVDWSTRRCLAFASRSYPAELKSELLSLSSTGPDELERAGVVSITLAQIYAAVTNDVLTLAHVRSQDVRSIGCHGQTVRHRPSMGFTIQLQNPALLAELTGIPVVADFRSRDLAAAGQGAPLAPAFHDNVFRHATKSRVVVNIGGISNVTILAPGRVAGGFDCGPGNVLMDLWVARHLDTPFDQDGQWAAGGQVSPALLESFMAEPFFKIAPPKSTGRELFNANWLDRHLQRHQISARDVQATLLELTARTIRASVVSSCESCAEIVVCGGGARNPVLMSRLADLTSLPVVPSDAHGIPSGQVEAMAFSWFAKCALEGKATALESITGSKHPVVLGAIYPA